LVWVHQVVIVLCTLNLDKWRNAISHTIWYLRCDVCSSNYIKNKFANYLPHLFTLSTLIILLVIVFIWNNLHYLSILVIHLIHPLLRCYSCLNPWTTNLYWDAFLKSY
jgi:hypothetical protein